MGRSRSCDPRARPHELPRKTDETVDLLSDYDLIVAVTDPSAFAPHAAWVSAYGEPLARWGDHHEVHGTRTSFLGVVYADGVKIDYTIWPAGLLEPSPRLKRSRRTSTSATACSSTRTGELRAGQHRPTERTSRPPRRKRSIAPSSRSSGGTPHTSPRPSGAARSSSPSSRSTTREVRRAAPRPRVADRARPRLVVETGSLRPRTRATPSRRHRRRACEHVRRDRASRRTGTRSSAPRPSSAASPPRSATRSATRIPRTSTRASARTSTASASSRHGPEGNSGSRDHSCQEPG